VHDATILKQGSVCVVGNICRDIKLAGLPSTAALFEDGETSVSGIIETIGGGGANSACAAAALGGKVTFVGKTGTDTLGEQLAAAMRQHGVNVHLKKDPKHPTGNTVVMGYAAGHRHFLSCQPNNESLTYEDMDLSAMDGCSHLLRADPWFSKSMLAGGNERLFKEARQRGLSTSLDINWDPYWSTVPSAPGSAGGSVGVNAVTETSNPRQSRGLTAEIAERKEQLRSLLPWVDLVHGNIRELAQFTDCTELDTALHQITAWGAKAIIVHMGSRGAGYFADGHLIEEKPTPAKIIQNATGAGDILSISMILLHQKQTMSLRQKLRLANTIVTQHIEGRLSLIPTL